MWRTIARACVTPACTILPWATPPRGHPLHDLRDEALGHLVHGLQGSDGMVRHPVATFPESLDQQAALHDQLAHRGEPARQHLTLYLFALGKQVVCFDRSKDRLHLRASRLDPPHRAGFEPRQGTTPALRQPPQDARFVGIPNGQRLRRRLRRQDTHIGKATIPGHMQQPRVDLLHTVLAKGRRGPGDVGVVPYRRLQIVLAPDAHPRHHMFGERRFHGARVEMLHQHQPHHGDIQRDIPG